MATYRDDLDIIKAAEKADTNKLTFNAITELDNKGLLGRYGNEGGGGDLWPGVPIVLKVLNNDPTPYEDLPQWVKDSMSEGYVVHSVEVLKNEMPQEPQLNSTELGPNDLFIVTYVYMSEYLTINNGQLISLEAASLDAPIIFVDDAYPGNINLIINWVTGEAFTLNGDK